VRLTSASDHDASRRLFQEYGTRLAPVAPMMRIFLDSLRLSAQAVRIISHSLSPNERGVSSRAGSKNCQLINEKGVELSPVKTSEILFFSKIGSQEVRS
jgi:hypothetical protein